MGLDGPSLNHGDIPDGLTTVAVTITSEVSGVSEAEADSGHGYPRVQAVQGWGLLVVDKHSAVL